MSQSYDAAEEPGRAALSALRCDAPILAAVGAVLLVLQVLRSRFIAACLRVGLAAGGILVLTDVVMIQLMDTRLSWGRFVTYAPQPEIVLQFLVERFGWLWAVAFVAALLAGMAWWCLSGSARNGRGRGWLIAVTVTAGALGLVPVDEDYVTPWMRENILAVNWPNHPETKRYTPDCAARLLDHYRAVSQPRTLDGLHERRNVILLIVESWSAEHSLAFGGVRDWTPALDRVATTATRFTRMHANGYCTAEGLVGLLAGVRLWQGFGNLGALDALPDVWTQRDSVPRTFRQAGFHTAFLTPGPLAFSGKGKWLQQIGFEHVEGGEHPSYREWPRFAFNAAPDEALYRRSLAWIEERSNTAPWFLTVETISSHVPYLDPETRRPDAEGSFRYADRWAGWFVEQLRRRRYFEKGILVIVGDHRALVPISAEEKRRFGLGFSSRVPLVLVDSTRPPGQVLDAVLKQGDLLPSFQHWLGAGAVAVDGIDTSMFAASSNESAIVLHRRGRERGVVDVVMAGGEGQVLIAGDATAFTRHSNLTAAQQAAALALIAHERLRPDRHSR